MGVGNYSLKSRLLPPIVLPKYSLTNRADRINMVIDYNNNNNNTKIYNAHM